MTDKREGRLEVVRGSKVRLYLDGEELGTASELAAITPDAVTPERHVSATATLQLELEEGAREQLEAICEALREAELDRLAAEPELVAVYVPQAHLDRFAAELSLVRTASHAPLRVTRQTGVLELRPVPAFAAPDTTYAAWRCPKCNGAGNRWTAWQRRSLCARCCGTGEVLRPLYSEEGR